jgi:hypothetical protein
MIIHGFADYYLPFVYIYSGAVYCFFLIPKYVVVLDIEINKHI